MFRLILPILWEKLSAKYTLKSPKNLQKTLNIELC